MPKLLSSTHSISLWDFTDANDTQELREESCALVATVTRGETSSKNPAALYRKLAKEAAEGKPSRAFEFLPVIANLPPWKDSGRFDYVDGCTIYSNVRAHNAWYNSPDTAKGFIAFQVEAPEFVWQQFATHELMGRFTSRISESRRVTDIGQYWRPEGITEDMLNCFLRDWSTEKVHNYLKSEGYKKEIYSRFPQGWELRKFWLSGWLQDPLAWRNLLMERGALPELWAKTWVQSQTKEMACTMLKMIREHYDVI